MENTSKLGLSFYYNYAKKTHRRNRVFKNTMIFLCALTIAFSAIVYNFGDAYVSEQEELINEISNREVFVINQTTPLTSCFDMDENLSITPEELKSISMISEIEQMYPFFEFRSFGYDMKLDTHITKSKMIVTNNETSKEYSFDETSDSGFDTLIILAYYPEQKIEKRLDVTNKKEIKNGVYISHHLAEHLNINDLDSCLVLELDIYVPVMLYDTVMYVGEEESEYVIDVDISEKVNLNFEVAGILNNNARNTYTPNGDNVIYVPYSVMQEILYKAQNTCTQNAEATRNYKEWHPSAYVVYAKSYNNIQSITSKIASIDPNFQSVSHYQDVDSMNKMIETARNTARWVIVIILIIIFLLMSIIYLNNTLRRKYEISVLKANGMTETELFKLVMAESVRHVIFVTLISTLVSFALIWVINMLFNFRVVEFNISIIIHNVLVSTLSILIPTIISIVAVNRFKPDQIMRN